MGTLQVLWAFLLAASPAFAADDAPAAVNIGAGTYVPSSSTIAPAVRASAPGGANTRPSIAVPTPDTIPAPSEVQLKSPEQLFGQYRTQKGEVKLEKMFLDRYKQSVVRVITRDLAGNELSRAMGVGVGRNGEYIATALSVVLGNSQQWADTIEITHASGNKYTSKVSLIDEEKNIVLLAPETHPAPIPFVRDIDERPQVSVFTLSFEDVNNKPEAKIHRGVLAAANRDNGLMSVSGTNITDAQAGTAVINSAGELVGMLLPGQRGVLSSALQTLIAKAAKAEPIPPTLVGMILGRGVLVSTKIPGAFPTISAALTAIKKGDAPRTDPARYIPARNRTVAPKDADKLVVKVMPGTYKEEKTISLGSNISLSGSGPENTTLMGADPTKPVLLTQNSSNVIIAGFRIVPAALQEMKAPAVIVSKANNVRITGNIVEAKGGVGVWAHESRNVQLNGNIFPRGKDRAISCDRSNMTIEANGFLGDWPTAISADRGCMATIQRSLFIDNRSGVMLSSQTGKMQIRQNTFVRVTTGVKTGGESPNFSLTDNLFYECTNGLYSSGDLSNKAIGRNAIWMTKFTARGRPMAGLDLVRSEPKFVAPENYDFRLSVGKGQIGAASVGSGLDLGAFQSSDTLGPYTQQFLHSLSAATGNPDLPQEWASATNPQ